MAKRKLDAYDKIKKLGFEIIPTDPYNQYIVPCLLPQSGALSGILSDVVFSPTTAGQCSMDVVDGIRFITIVIDPEHYSMRTLVHELIHAKNYVFDVAGVRLDTDNDEAEAYFVGMIAAGVFDVFEALMTEWGAQKKVDSAPA